MKNFKQSGFTLVELMVVVAIIGVLSAVAVPNFKKYQAKSKTSEAKLHLSAIYTAEQAFSSDYDTFATCLVAMGYNPQPEVMQRYYSTGFTVGTAGAITIANTNGATACTAFAASAGGFNPVAVLGSGVSNFAAGKQIGTNAASTVANLATRLGTMTAAPTAFTAGALGYVAADKVTAVTGDFWTIDNNKSLVHATAGY